MKISISINAQIFFEPETEMERKQLEALSRVAVSFKVDSFSDKSSIENCEKGVWGINLRTI